IVSGKVVVIYQFANSSHASLFGKINHLEAEKRLKMQRLGTYQLVLLLLFCGVYLGTAKPKNPRTKRPPKATGMDINNCTNAYIEVERKINMMKTNIDRNSEDELKTTLDDLVNLLKKCTKFDKKIVGNIPRTTKKNALKTLKAITLTQKTMQTFIKYMNKAKSTASKVNNGVERDITKCITDLTFSYTYYGFTEQGTLLSKITRGCVYLVQSTSGLDEQVKKELDDALDQIKKWVKQRKAVEILLKKVKVPKANYTPDSPPMGRIAAGGRSGQGAPCSANLTVNGTYTCECDDTVGFKLVGDAWERECQPTPVGFWPLNKLQEGSNFAENKIFGSAEIQNVNFVEGVSGNASDAIKLFNASSSLRIESIFGGITLRSFTWMIYVKPLARNGGVSILKHRIGNTEITISLVNNKIVASIQVKGAKYEVKSEEVPEEEWAFVVLSLSKTKRIRLLVFKEDDEEESILREKDINDPMDDEQNQTIVIGGKLNDPPFIGLCVACLKFYIVDLTIDEVKGARQACRKDILLASWPLNKKYDIKDISGNDKQLLFTPRLKPFLPGPQDQSKGSITLGREENLRHRDGLKTSSKVEVADKITWLGSFYIDQRDVSDTSFKYAIIDFSTENEWGFRVWVDFDSNGGNVGNLVASVAEPLPDNTIKVLAVILMRVWYHCAFSYDGKTGFSALYLNGARIEYQTFEMKWNGINAFAHIGKSKRRGLDIMRGRVTCFELYEAVLNNAEVNQIYNQCHEGSSTTIDNATCSIQTVQPVFLRNVGGIEGNKAKPHSWPWMVQIRHRDRGDFLCGGSLYKPDIVITAAHCFDERDTSPGQFIVVIGSHYRANLSNAINVTLVANHPDYARVGTVPLHHDIAIIKLAKCVEYSSKIQPICLTKYKVFANEDERFECVALGWGHTGKGELSEELKQLRLPTIPYDECTKMLTDVDGASSFCAGHLGAKKPDTCGGDSGGPLMCQFGTDLRHMLTGVTSWGKNACGSKNSAGVYTSIFKHKQWITDVSNALSDCGPSDDYCKQDDFNNQTDGVLRRFEVLSETIRGITTNIATLSESNAEMGRSIGQMSYTVTGNDLGNGCSTGECCADNSMCSGNVCVCMTGFYNVDSVCRSVNG
ncbi:unnamed protein product, partial [Owenia fusiformis]